MSRSEIEYDLPWSWTPRRVASALSSPSVNAYSARLGNRFAGFSLARFDERCMHLLLLAVAPDATCRGIGARLLDWQLDAAMTAGLVECRLEVRRQNTLARRFYRQAGFIETGILPGYYHRHEDALSLRLAPIRLPQRRQPDCQPRR